MNTSDLVRRIPSDSLQGPWGGRGPGPQAAGAFPNLSQLSRVAGPTAMANKRGQKAGVQRGNRQRFPYEPRVIGGKLMMPAELQAIHRYAVETPVLENVTDEIRAVIEVVWPELMSKLPPKPRSDQ